MDTKDVKKIIERQKNVNYITGSDLEDWLNVWLQQYISPRSDHGTSSNAEKPPLDVRVFLRPVHNLDVAYDMESYLRSGYQFSPARNLRITARLMCHMLG